jgi:hypothetical protein
MLTPYLLNRLNHSALIAALSLMMNGAPALAETIVEFSNGQRQYIDSGHTRHNQSLDLHHHLELCTELGNTHEACRQQIIDHETNRAKERSIKKDDIVIFTWMEDSQPDSEVTKR